MKTVEEAFDQVQAKLEDPVFSASLQELMNEPKLLKMVLTILDSSRNDGFRTLYALCIGILIGVEQERNSDG